MGDSDRGAQRLPWAPATHLQGCPEPLAAPELELELLWPRQTWEALCRAHVQPIPDPSHRGVCAQSSQQSDGGEPTAPGR